MEIDPILDNLLVSATLRQLSSEANTNRMLTQHNWSSDHWRTYFELLDYCGDKVLKAIKRPFRSEEMFYISDRVKLFLEMNNR